MDDLLTRLESRREAYLSKAAELDSAIRVIRAELALETALTGPPAGDRSPAAGAPSNGQGGLSSVEAIKPSEVMASIGLGGDLAGATVRMAAEKVLSELRGGRWMNYRDVAKEAMRRGYHGHNPEQDEKSIQNTFYHTMKRKRETFDSEGARFRLKAKPATGATSS